MTREEASKWLKKVRDNTGINELSQALDMAIKALEQEPCEDAISRQAVLDIAKSSKSNWIDNSVLFKRVNELSSVNPQPKTAHWIDDRCSECGKGIEDLIDSREWYRNEQPNFCPFCGVKLINSQESEDKE